MPAPAPQPVVVKEFQVPLQNRPGSFGALDTALGRAKVNLRGYALETHDEVGTLRFVPDDPARAQAWLQASGHTFRSGDALAVPVPDAPAPGFVGGIAERLGAAGVNIEASYPITLEGRRHVVLGVGDAVEAARKALG